MKTADQIQPRILFIQSFYDANQGNELVDNWLTCDSMAEAEALFAEAIQSAATFTASIAVCVKSTDYECMKAAEPKEPTSTLEMILRLTLACVSTALLLTTLYRELNL